MTTARGTTMREDLAFAAWCLTPRQLARSLCRTRWAHVRALPATAGRLAREFARLAAEPWKTEGRPMTAHEHAVSRMPRAAAHGATTTQEGTQP